MNENLIQAKLIQQNVTITPRLNEADIEESFSEKQISTKKTKTFKRKRKRKGPIGERWAGPCGNKTKQS
jgi:hypothetical protein